MTPLNRRQFLAGSAALGAAALFSKRSVRAASSPDKLRLGLIGCGGRGYGAVVDALVADRHTELVAIADLFPDRLEVMHEQISRGLAGRARRDVYGFAESDVERWMQERVKVSPEHRFSGFDCHEKLCSLPEVDIVLMAPPPVFRPLHLESALRHGKHVFMEKPVCVDAVGARKMLELAKVADEKKLCVVAGTQRRHQAGYLEGMKRLHDGQIGDIVAAQCYWLQDGYIGANLKAKELPHDEMAYQIRNWLVYVWSCGDHIVEQHMHNIDVVLWAIGRMPDSSVAQGGRGVDLPMPAYGNRYSHFAAEFDFGGGLRAASYCRQEPGTYSRVSESIVGTKGVLEFNGRNTRILGEKAWKFEGEETDPYVQEHIDLIAAIRSGTHLNETRDVTLSSAVAVLGRESAYTGRAIKFDWLMERSQQDLTPKEWAWGPKPIDPLPVPGKTPLV
ncbi:Gfo/Idh/MocA family oxidoreductase [Opitutales bacterium ASA1]|uniref:Gfo/Idh/MocA family protein n=1 Tax=Congregicoccus parvus TaxID=3081749 RepID=UPI002B2E9EE3|nr:Gfo/Idh/MocA family oxidoreductase [Opitutales bacterium ASA1]